MFIDFNKIKKNLSKNINIEWMVRDRERERSEGGRVGGEGVNVVVEYVKYDNLEIRLD